MSVTIPLSNEIGGPVILGLGEEKRNDPALLVQIPTRLLPPNEVKGKWRPEERKPRRYCRRQTRRRREKPIQTGVGETARAIFEALRKRKPLNHFS